MTKNNIEEAVKIRNWFANQNDSFIQLSIMTEFLDSRQLTFYTLINYSRYKEERCYFKYDVIMNRFKISRATISKTLKSLRNMGIIHKHIEEGSGNYYYTISASAENTIVKITNLFYWIPAWKIREALAGINLGTASIDYLKEIIIQSIPEASCEIPDSDCDNEQLNVVLNI